MIKERRFKAFDDGWSRRKKLCYDLVCAVTGNLGYVELIVKPDRKLSHHTSQKLRKITLQNAEAAVQMVQELYAIICAGDREAKERTNKVKK